MITIVLGMLSGLCVFSSLVFGTIDYHETHPAPGRLQVEPSASYKSLEQGPR